MHVQQRVIMNLKTLFAKLSNNRFSVFFSILGLYILLSTIIRIAFLFWSSKDLYFNLMYILRAFPLDFVTILQLERCFYSYIQSIFYCFPNDGLVPDSIRFSLIFIWLLSFLLFISVCWPRFLFGMSLALDSILSLSII